jgi:hypothetical protein
MRSLICRGNASLFRQAFRTAAQKELLAGV